MTDCPAKPAAMPCPATEAHARHLENLKGIDDKRLRDEYIDGVRRSEGKFFANWLQEEHGKWWETRKFRKAKTP